MSIYGDKLSLTSGVGIDRMATADSPGLDNFVITDDFIPGSDPQLTSPLLTEDLLYLLDESYQKIYVGT